MARLKDNSDANPSRYVGRWAMALNHVLFKIEAAGPVGHRITEYQGTGLQGQRVITQYPVAILRAEDEEWINDHAKDGAVDAGVLAGGAGSPCHPAVGADRRLLGPDGGPERDDSHDVSSEPGL